MKYTCLTFVAFLGLLTWVATGQDAPSRSTAIKVDPQEWINNTQKFRLEYQQKRIAALEQQLAAAGPEAKPALERELKLKKAEHAYENKAAASDEKLEKGLKGAATAAQGAADRAAAALAPSVEKAKVAVESELPAIIEAAGEMKEAQTKMATGIFSTFKKAADEILK
jgi:hypothetical protein